MGAFDDLLPKPSAPSAAPALSAPGNPFANLGPAPVDNRPGMGETAARSGVQGMTFGLADESYGLMQGIGSMVRGEGFSKGYEEGVKGFREREKAGKERNPVTAMAAEIAGGMGTGLGLARGGVTLMRQGMILPHAMGAGAVEGAGYGALYGAGNAEGGLQDRAQGAAEGAAIGGVIGGSVPAVARGVSAATSSVITPMSVSRERQAMIDALTAEGVPLSAGQRSGSRGLQYAESVLGDAPFVGSGQRLMGEQAEAFTDAAMRKAGGSGRALPDNIQANFDRIGRTFSDLSSRNTLQADRQLVSDVGSAVQKYEKLLEPQQKKIVGDLAMGIVDRIRAGGGTMPGDEYQAVRSWLSTASQKEGNQYVASAMKGLRDALDNNMMRSITPEDAAAWQQARREYGNIKDIAKAAGGAGADTAGGLISPQALRQATASGKNREAYARGQGDFAELTRAGNAIMTPLPNTGTAQRSLVTGMAGGGGATAAMTGDPLMAAVVALGPSAFGKALWSGPIQRYLSNQTVTPQIRALIESQARAALQGGAQSQAPRLAPSD
jgi:hypothetical protein